MVNAGLGDLGDIDWDRVEPHNQAAHAAGETVDSLTLTRSLNQLHRMTRDIVVRFDRVFDLFVTPTLTIEPPAVGVLEAVHRQRGPVTEVVAMAAFTAVFNITGQPAVSLPLHTAAVRPAGGCTDRGRALAGGPADPGWPPSSRRPARGPVGVPAWADHRQAHGGRRRMPDRWPARSDR